MTPLLLTPTCSRKLRTEMQFVKPQDRPDALQEAWLAQLEGRDPARAVGTFAQRLRRERTRVQVSSPLIAVL